MYKSKCILPFIMLCLVQGSFSKPYSNNVIEGRGIGSTIWSWITYPFTWWSNDVTELPEKDQLVSPDPTSSYITSVQNIIVSCNDQTCTTTRCDKYGCFNVTCNIYDTDVTGVCRNYNTEIKPEEPTTPNYTDSISKPSQDDKTTSSTPIISTTAISAVVNNPAVIEERPLELEAVLSSTVTESDKVGDA